jgi:hypothetical protein
MATGTRGFLILHGYENHRPIGHWQRWLADELESRGHVVLYPQLPAPDAPVLERWRRETLRELAALRAEVGAGGTVAVVAHSASAMLWLNEQQSGTRPQVDRVALVSPPEADVVAGIPPVAAFAWRPAGSGADQDPARLALGAPEAIVVVGGGDEFAPHGAEAVAPFVEARVVEVPGAGHITPTTGYGPWPEMLDWCEGRPAFR